jgi:hypothetical protein
VRAIVREDDAWRIAPDADDDLVAVRAAGLAAIATPRDVAPPASEIELRAHQRATLRIHEAGASLPSRFGQLFNDEDALAAALVSNRSRLVQSLELIGERIEMSITLEWKTPHPDQHTQGLGGNANTSSPMTGRAFLEASAARERERRQAEQVVADLVTHLSVEQALIRHSICPRDGVAAIVALLVARDAVGALRRRVDSYNEGSVEVRASVYGPLPPYSFAS